MRNLPSSIAVLMDFAYMWLINWCVAGLWTDGISIWPRSVWTARSFNDKSTGSTRNWSSTITIWCTTADAIRTDAYVSTCSAFCFHHVLTSFVKYCHHSASYTMVCYRYYKFFFYNTYVCFYPDLHKMMAGVCLSVSLSV